MGFRQSLLDKIGAHAGSDYSQPESDNIVEELLTVHVGKLEREELDFLDAIHGVALTREQRDKLIKLYDSIGEAGY